MERSNKFIQISDIRFRKNEIYTYKAQLEQNYKRLLVYLKHYNSYWYFDYKTEEELNEQVDKLDAIFLNNDIVDEPIKKLIIDLFSNIYSEIKNDGKLLGHQDIVDMMLSNPKTTETVQKIKNLLNGTSD